MKHHHKIRRSANDNKNCLTKPEKKDKYEAYQDDFAKDFPKGIATHFAFMQGSIVTDLERTIQNIAPPTTIVMAHYRVMQVVQFTPSLFCVLLRVGLEFVE